MNKFIYKNLKDFNVDHTLNCGQIFRYSISGNVAHVYSLDKMVILTTFSDRIEIESEDVEYFINFFDLNKDYSKIKAELKHDKFLANAVNYGYGIHIINNTPFEMIVSFIISANNNIGRIKKSIECLCSKFGTNMGDYYAFPTLEQFKLATIDDLKAAGLGYRAEQLYETLQKMTNNDIDCLINMTKDEQFKYLISLKGIGEKVANCVLLFGLNRKDVFPVDTWINKVYNKLTNSVSTDRKSITRELSLRYGKLSGYAQQYFFYYFRDNKIN